ncbi:MAG: hypothetical protein IT376_10510 [Polyangiaceae bacterium]|nr:hypothetical protein [Polyangiaceae bacterium]
MPSRRPAPHPTLRGRVRGALRGSLAIVALVALAGCGDRSAVALTASLSGASLSLTTAALGSRLDGGFTLVLELGPEAPRPTEVTLEAFEIRSTGSPPEALVSPIGLAEVAQPIVLGKGERRSVPLTLDQPALLGAAERDALCAGPVTIGGAVADTLSGGTTSPESGPVVVDGC